MIPAHFSVGALSLAVLCAAPSLAQSDTPTPQVAEFRVLQSEVLKDRGSMTHAFADYDNDGDLDLFVGFRSGQPNRLYRNDGGVLKDVATELGVADTEDTRAVAWGDYDTDGRIDLYVGFGAGNRVYRNDGKGFTDVTKALGLVMSTGNARQLSWLDYDNDGDVDLFVAMRDIPNLLFRNEGGTFVEVSKSVGITGSRATMGGVWFDYDLDGDLDLYLGNMDGYANRMYRNDGARFVDVAPELGVDGGGRPINPNPGDHDMAGTIRPDIADYDNDGDFDIFVTTLGGTDGFYRNDGGKFVSVAADFGLAHTSYRGTAAWADYDNDGWVDLYASGTLYRNNRGAFVKATPAAISRNVGGYGSIWADYDNNGTMDLALSSSNHYVLANGLAPRVARRSLQVMVLNEKGRHTRAGTEVRLYAVGTRTLLGTRILDTGSGYNSQSVRPVHFGLPTADAVDVKVTTMSSEGRKVAWVKDVDPGKHTGSHLSVRVDRAGRVVQ